MGVRPSAVKDANRLRIVLAAYSLAGSGGTESYSLTVAHQLRRLGHDVTLAAEEIGPLAELAGRDGLPVARLPAGLPPECDVAIVQDAIVTAAIVQRYPEASMVHVAHAAHFEPQHPVLLPGVIDAVVVLSDLVAHRLRALPLKAPVVRLRQPIDVDRFAPAGPLPERPRRALLLGNYLHGDRRDAIVEAWRQGGVECVQVGFGEEQLDVRPAIASTDIVVAKARAALEGMSCARAVYVYDHFGGDGWVSPERYEDLEAGAFGGLATPLPKGPAELRSDLDDYRPSMGWLNRELVQTHHNAHRHTAELVEVLRSVAPSRGREMTAVEEVSRLARLMWHAERRTLDFQYEAASLRPQLVALEEHASECSEREAAAERQLAETQERLAEAERRSVEAEGQLADTQRRLAETQRQLGHAQSLLGTRRAAVGFALGRAADVVRGAR